MVDDVARIAEAEDGWITFNGGPCPVAPTTAVDYRLRSGLDGTLSAGKLLWRYDSFVWEIYETMPRDCQIVAYRVAHLTKESHNGR